MWGFSETVFAADGHGLISGGHKQMAILEVVRVKCGSRGQSKEMRPEPGNAKIY